MLPYKSYYCEAFGKYKVFIFHNIIFGRSCNFKSKERGIDYWKLLEDNKIEYRGWYDWKEVEQLNIYDYLGPAKYVYTRAEFRKMYRNIKFTETFLDKLK